MMRKGEPPSAEAVKLRERFEEGVATLKQRGRRGRSLYELPWYVIIGAPGSGKTTALLNSGLKFPLEQRVGKGALRGVGGTRNCDWWFTDEAVFLDTAGRYTTQDSDPASDVEGSLPVALVNETFVRLYWPGQDPIGRRIRMGSNDPKRPWMTVVGVIRDERHNGLTGAIKEKFFVPYAQFPAARSGDAARNMSLVVRTSGDPAALAAPIRAEVRRLDPSLPVANVRRMTDVVAASMATPRLTGSLLTAFGVLALFLAAVGVSGVLSYLVSRRRREIGIRMALGASRRNVLGLIVRRGLLTAAWGVLAGIVGGFALTRLMESLLYGVAPRDPATFVIVALLLFGIALVASALPALRAARVDPLEALRSE